jgi:16S rRNA (guanine527-N7)-methyltransferase
MPSNSTDRAIEAYTRLVREWAPKLDLISPGDVARLEERHITDSLRALPLFDEAAPGAFVDVGSGAGLPGIPLAIASGRYVRLVEPRERRAAFLEECLRSLELPGEVVPRTAQAAVSDDRLARAHAVALARALAPPEEALRLILPLVSPGGIAAVFLGTSAKIPAGAEEFTHGIAIVRAE